MTFLLLGLLSVLNQDAHFPEGPLWHDGKLYYVEYDRNTVTVWDGKSNRVFATLKGCGPSAVVRTPRGEFLTTCYDSGTIGRLSADGTTLVVVTHDERLAAEAGRVVHMLDGRLRD